MNFRLKISLFIVAVQTQGFILYTSFDTLRTPIECIVKLAIHVIAEILLDLE